MRYLYLLLDIGSLSFPLLFSFHPKFKFYKYWKSLFLSIGIMMSIFIPWDIVFTNHGIWGFNENYFSGLTLFSLPLAEWLFFICIPFSCVFIHYSLLYFFPKMKIQKKTTTIITNVLIGLLLVLSFIFYDKWYTLINFMYAVILLIFVMNFDFKLLKSFYLTFLVMLIPFFLVNGILTGSFIENEVVWYNNAENLNLRIFTIPIEDTVYAFSMILTTLVLTKYFHRKWTSQEEI